jgi:hypothetical protein
VLVHVIRRYHYELDTLEQGEVVGFRSPGPLVIGPETDYAFGTAVAIRPGSRPAGVAGGMFPTSWPSSATFSRSARALCSGAGVCGVRTSRMSRSTSPRPIRA